ncbi:hypothetical protein JQ633_32005 [Bradyrhizobium tropiciagri]|uniref:hypothetical protein n=1 Tax=Bradyrhizobium tropiciagri TaxID=312253 RepID=UPI001BA4C4F9|nr:hypothetical protein [Bradyrhizobium tropiciagri]MBR0875021.1 hypothetical protein [Bradyrhizobium tropiciagri]
MTKAALRPEILMGIVWIAFVTIFEVAPIHYLYTPGFFAWALMACGVVTFGLGSSFATMPVQMPERHRKEEFGYLDRVIILCAVAGLAGCALIAIDKVFLSGQDWSIGITALRDRRSEQVLEGVPIRRSVLLYIGYLTVSFSCAATCLFLLKGEKVGRLAGWLAQASIFAMVGYSVLYGGRMPILLVVLLAVACGMVRALTGQTFVPRGWYLWPKAGAVVVAFVAYINLVWTLRRNLYSTDFAGFLRHADERWDLHLSPWLVDAVQSGHLPATSVMDFASNAVYLTHSPTIVQRAVEHAESLSMTFGLYQIGILSPLFDVFAPQLKLPETMRSELASAGMLGWYPNAWGAWLVDAGYYLGPVVILFWGFLSGAAYAHVVRGGSVAAQLMLAFAYMAILISPLNGPFGMANSFLIFCSFAVVAGWIAWRGRQHASVGATL